MSVEHESGLTLSGLRAVVAVAELRSFGAAARLLGSSQPAVSRAVGRVERNLGVALFDRSTRRVDLTPAGRGFVEAAQLAIIDIDRAAESARLASTHPATALAVAMLPSVSEAILAPTIIAMAVPPKRVSCAELLQRALEDDVTSGRADLGILDTSGLPAGLVATTLWTEDGFACVPVDHPLARRDRLQLRDLDGHALVGFPPRARLRVKLDAALASVHQRRSPWITVEQYQTLFDLVAAGLGIGVIPGVITNRMPESVRAVVLDEPMLRRTVGVAARPGTPLSAIGRSFVDALVAVATAHPALHVPE